MDMKNITIEEARARISPTSDIFARWLLSAPNHEHLTKAFINAVLEDAGHEQIASVTILSPFNLAQSMTRKETVLDVKVSDSSGRTYDVEIQTTTAEMFWNRITYYNNAMYNAQLGTSEQYDRLKNTTVIALLAKHIYSMKSPTGPEEKLHHCSLVVHEDNHDELFYPNGDPEKFHIIELDRFALNPEALYTVQGTARRKLAPPLYRWLRFFTQGADIHFMEKYKETDVAIKEAKADYEDFLTDAQLREAQFEHEMFLHDQAQAKSDAHKEGYEEGMERGEHAKAVAVAKSMKADGLSFEKISVYTGLSSDEISKL